MTNRPAPEESAQETSTRVVIHVLGALVAAVVLLPGGNRFFYPLAAVITVALGLAGWNGRALLLRKVRKHAAPLLLLALPALWLQVHFPSDWQDWAEETPVAVTALNLHLDRTLATPVTGIFAYPEGPLLLDGGRTEPGLFPLVASLLHDLTGQRPQNVRIANGLLSYALLVAAWFAFRRLAGRIPALVVGTLLLLTPLLSMDAKGGGTELLLTFLLTAQLALWLRPAGSWRREAALVGLGLLAALAHPAGCLALLACPSLVGGTAADSRPGRWSGVLRGREWMVLGVLLLCGQVFLNRERGPGPEDLAEAFEKTIFRAFSPEAQEPALPLLMLAGLVCGLFLLLSLKAKPKAGEAVRAVPLLLRLFPMFLVGLALGVGREALHGSSWYGPQLLTLHVAAALTLAWAFGLKELTQPLPWRWIAPPLALGLQLWVMPKITEPACSMRLALDGRRVLRDFAREQPARLSCFYALDRPEGLIAEGISAGPPDLLVRNAPAAGLSPLLSSRVFSRYYVLVTSTWQPKEGVWVADRWQSLPDRLVTTVVRERWISPDRKAHVHEVVGMRLADGTVVKPPSPYSGPRMKRAELAKWLSPETGENK